MTDNLLGTKIRQYRKSKGLTQERLAEQIGIDNKHLSRIEKGRHMPTYTVLRKLSRVLDFDIYQIEEQELNSIPKPDKFFTKSLYILNSADTKEEKKYYLEALLHAQKGIKLGLDLKK